MAASRTVPGQVIHDDEPDWTALIDVVGHRLASWFMWMYEIELADGTRLHAYKHMATRRYLHIDADGTAFEYQGDSRYRELALPTAIARAFAGWEHSSPSKRDATALRSAVQRARAAA